MKQFAQFGDYTITTMFHEANSEYEIALKYKGQIVIEDCLPIKDELARENAAIIVSHFSNIAKHAAEQIALVTERLDKAKTAMKEILTED